MQNRRQKIRLLVEIAGNDIVDQGPDTADEPATISQPRILPTG
jgi:hypothetical protein